MASPSSVSRSSSARRAARPERQQQGKRKRRWPHLNARARTLFGFSRLGATVGGKLHEKGGTTDAEEHSIGHANHQTERGAHVHTHNGRAARISLVGQTTRGSAALGMVRKLLDSVFDGSPQRLVAHLIESGQLDEDDRKEIQKLLDTKGTQP